MKIQAEHIWPDGYALVERLGSVANLRSKTKILDHTLLKNSLPPFWGFDGSSTEQALGEASDCLLKPVFACPDPLRKTDQLPNNILVLCEVLNPDGTPHVSNTRHKLVETAERYREQEVLFGLEQEYFLYDRETQRPLGWPRVGYPAPQGEYYCRHKLGKMIKEEHTQACIDAGLEISGTNSEVAPGQWEYQIGPLSAPLVADHLNVARWLMEEVADKYGVDVSLDPKPFEGWNGSGCHTNFSTKKMREGYVTPQGSHWGLTEIHSAIRKLSLRHKEHITVYGIGNDKRLTGLHETSSITKFVPGPNDDEQSAIGNRGASVRIPAPVARAGAGYLEDRRPASNCDPNDVCRAMLETICGNGFTK